MNNQRINNYRMGAYAALAVGLINLRYQTGSESNLAKSLALVIPGGLLLAISLIAPGKKLLETRAAAIAISIIGAALLAYSFIV
jgi:hypothetical protein